MNLRKQIHPIQHEETKVLCKVHDPFGTIFVRKGWLFPTVDPNKRSALSQSPESVEISSSMLRLLNLIISARFFLPSQRGWV